MGVSNESLLSCGLVISAIGYSMIYFFWTKPTTTFLFVFPVVLATLCFPFLGSPTRSIFTMVVDSKPNLRHHQGTMQAVMSMVVSTAGFATPGLISAFVLRTPEEVDASSDKREFTPWALFAPTLSLVVLAGHLYVQWIKKPLDQQIKKKTDGPAGETTGLLDSLDEDSSVDIPWSRERYQVPDFDPRTTAARRESLMLMGVIPQITFEDYKEAEAHEHQRYSTGSMTRRSGHHNGKPNRVSFYL